MFIVYCPNGYRVKGFQVREAMDMLEPGDIVCRYYDNYIDGFFIPGHYSHSSVYIGNDVIIHALADGVQKIDVIDFLKCDGFAILKPRKKEVRAQAVKLAKSFLGRKYDFNFDISENYKKNDQKLRTKTAALYCHEMTRSCFPKLDIPAIKPSIWNGMIRSSKKQYLAQSFFDSRDFKVAYESDTEEVRN
jgi:uncharacterized protein YycO